MTLLRNLEIKCNKIKDGENISVANLVGKGFSISITGTNDYFVSLEKNAVYYLSIIPRDGSA